MLWLVTLAGAFLGGRAVGIREERTRLIDRLFAEQDRYVRDQTESTSFYQTRIAEDFREFQRLLAGRDAMLDNRDVYIQKLLRQLAEAKQIAEDSAAEEAASGG
jgi:hypothetical protein